MADTTAAVRTETKEIVVTGERISRSLRETDASVEVFDRRRLEREPGVHRLDDLFDSIPNVVLGNPGQGPAIRGQDSTGSLIDLAAFLGGTRPRMTLNVDGRAASYNEFVFGAGPLWDVAQLEVFRSPQSTVEGRNSIAGAIYIRTNSPTFEWQGAARALIDDGGARQGSIMVSGPLIGDTLAFRIAADGRRDRPWSRLSGTQAGADPSDDDYGLLRGKLLATPAGLSGARFELAAQHLRSKSPQTVTARPAFEARRDPSTGYGIFANRVTSATLRAEVPLLPSLSSQSIISVGRSRVRRFAPPGRGEALIRVSDRSIETRIDWRPSDKLRISSGGHALENRLDQQIDLSAIVGPGAFDDRQVALGLFGEVDLALGSGVSATASIRRQSDRQRRTGAITGLLTIPVDYDRTFTFWLPRVALRWDVEDEVRLGASIQKASNPGGTSINFVTGNPETLDAETLWNAELFARARLFDGRLDLSANFFRNWHRGAQRALPRLFVMAGSTSLTWYDLFNVERARSEGLEAAADWRATRTLTLRAGLGLLRTRIEKGGAAAAMFDGKLFGRAPSRTLNLGMDWAPNDAISVGARIRHHGSYFSDDLNVPARKIDSGTEVDLRAAYRRGPLTLTVYARNATDEFAVTYLLSPTTAIPNKPRQIGIGLETRF